jgi:integrase
LCELALFNLGIDSKLRGCDLVALKVRDVCPGDQVATRAIVMQHKTQRPVQFEITQATRDALQAWMKQSGLKSEDYLFPSRLHDSPDLGPRQYARILGHWVDELGLDSAEYGTHSMRRTKATLIYRRTKNLRAVHSLVIRSLNRPCDTSELRSTTPWKSRSRRRYDAAVDERARPGRAAGSGVCEGEQSGTLMGSQSWPTADLKGWPLCGSELDG